MQMGRFLWFRLDSQDGSQEIPATDAPFVTPDPTFRADLKQRLLAAHPQLTERRHFWHTLTADPLRIWSMIATLPVIVGIVALLWRRSQRTVEQPA